VDNQTHPLGVALVVPKRHARRAVTRNLVKRQMREALRRHLANLSSGQLLISQRAAFDPQQYPSAASPALRAAVRRELDILFAQAASR
jgi:ribonuclease P protein component